MINRKKLIVFDFETDGPDPNTCNPIQLAAVVVDPVKLEIIPNSEFSVDIKPPNIMDENYYSEHEKTIKWHAKNKGVSPQEVFESWKEHGEERIGWEMFTQYVMNYRDNCRTDGGTFKAPIICGYNILDFDMLIVDRLAAKYKTVTKAGEQNVVWRRDMLDLLLLMFFWFESEEEPTSYSLDSLRVHFGIDTEGGHEALKDVRDTAYILIKFLNLHRALAKKVKWNKHGKSTRTIS